jgi:hypothetical protein
MGVSVSQQDNYNNMFAYLRSNPGANYRFITTTVATNMRVHVRNQRPILTGLDSSNTVVAGILSDIYLREFACTIKTLQQVNCVAVKYHEHAFDNTDAYIEGQMPTQSHEMNAEQRHAAQLLLGVGNSYSEINATLRMLDSRMLGGSVSFQSVTECNPEMRAQLSQQFSADASFAEDMFDRLHHLVKQVWSLVNMLAFSNLFRFADHPMVLPSSEDSIFIPYIPNARQAEEVQVEEEVQDQQTRHECNDHVCNDCGKTFRKQPQHVVSPDGSEFYRCHSCAFKHEFPDEYRIGDDESDEDEDEGEAEMNAKTPQEQQKHFKKIAEMLADGKITPEQACSMIEKLRDLRIFADDILEPENQEQEKQKGFNEIAGVLSDYKITREEACEVFVEWINEWMVVASDS